MKSIIAISTLILLFFIQNIYAFENAVNSFIYIQPQKTYDPYTGNLNETLLPQTIEQALEVSDEILSATHSTNNPNIILLTFKNKQLYLKFNYIDAARILKNAIESEKLIMLTATNDNVSLNSYATVYQMSARDIYIWDTATESQTMLGEYIGPKRYINEPTTRFGQFMEGYFDQWYLKKIIFKKNKSLKEITL